MKTLSLILLSLALTATAYPQSKANDDMMQLWHSHKVEYTTNELNAVGPTTSLTLRTLSNPSPTTSNAIWLAMPGTAGADDGGVNAVNATAIADSSNPVETLSKAIAVVNAQPTRNTIHVIRNGYVGDIYFIFSGTAILPINSIIQVELGEVASIEAQGVGTIFNNDRSRFNGFYIILNAALEDFPLIKIDNSTGGFIDGIVWCYFKFKNNFTPSVVLHDNNVSGDFLQVQNVNIRNTIFDRSNAENITTLGVGKGGVLNQYTFTVTTIDFTDNIFINDLRSTQAWLFFAVSAGGNTIIITHNTIINGSCGVLVYSSVTAATGTIFIADNIIYNCITNVEERHNVGPLNFVFRNNFWGNGTFKFGSYHSPNPYVNAIVGISPLFFNQLGLDLRLMDQRRKAPNSNQYFDFTSKAVYWPERGQIPGDDTRDLGPYNVSYTLIVDTWAKLKFDPNEISNGFDIDHTLKNYAAYDDADGDARRAFTAFKRRIRLKFLDNGWVGTRRSWEFVRAFKSIGAKRWYPHDVNGIFGGVAEVSALPGNQWQADLQFFINLDSPGMVDTYYEGFVVELFQDPLLYYMRIVDNGENYLILEDHRGTQNLFTAGTYQLRCQYLPCEFSNDTMVQNFPLWGSGSNAMYPKTDSIAWGTTAKDEGHIRELALAEGTDDE